MQSFRSPEKESLLKSVRKSSGRRLDWSESQLKTSLPSLLGLKALLAGIVFILVVSLFPLDTTFKRQYDLADRAAWQACWKAKEIHISLFCNCLVLLSVSGFQIACLRLVFL